MGGIELLKGLREDDGYTETPVIVMTSFDDPCDLDECERLKVAQHVMKPVSLASFAKAIADAFNPSLRQRVSLAGMSQDRYRTAGAKGQESLIG
jgi:CheY-like chemotaxis protein